MGILIIDTCGDVGWVIYAENNIPLHIYQNTNSKTYLEWLHQTIATLFLQINKNNINAIAATNGPGSYTGVRIGVAAAQGLAYTLKKPLIALNIFDVYYHMFKAEPNITSIIPMIDARRMEVFTKAFYLDGTTEYKETALILQKDIILPLVTNKIPLFCGNGSHKLTALFNKTYELNINNKQYNQTHLTKLAYIHYYNNQLIYNAILSINYCKNFNELGQENWTQNESKQFSTNQ